MVTKLVTKFDNAGITPFAQIFEYSIQFARTATDRQKKNAVMLLKYSMGSIKDELDCEKHVQPVTGKIGAIFDALKLKTERRGIHTMDTLDN